jgi:hypothetical protein
MPRSFGFAAADKYLGVTMADDEIKRLMHNLEETINETFSQSESVKESIRSIKAAGYELFLIVDATIAFHPKDKGDPVGASRSKQPEEPVKLRITSEDAKFLKSLKISVDR